MSAVISNETNVSDRQIDEQIERSATGNEQINDVNTRILFKLRSTVLWPIYTTTTTKVTTQIAKLK